MSGQKFMLRVVPAKGAAYTLELATREVADEAAQRLVAAGEGHASLYSVQHLQDYWHKSTATQDRDLVA